MADRSIVDKLYWNEDGLKKRLEYDGDGNVIYIGKAKPGKPTSEAWWQIQKLTWSGSNPVSIDFAGGSDEFNQIWDNRASLDYS